MLFPTVEVENMDFFGSDHRPVYIYLRKSCNSNFTKSPKQFTFEHKWLLEDDFADCFQRSWEGLEVSGSPATKLLLCRSDLSDWAGDRFNQLGKKIKHLRNQLSYLMCNFHAKDNYEQIQQLEKDIERLSEQDEIHWQQRARVNCLRQGDRNTKFFHSSASSRRQTNFIKGLYDTAGSWCSDEKKLAEITFDYFTNLFSTSSSSFQDINEMIDFTDCVVNNHLNDILCLPLSADEVKGAVFDGFTALFYQKLWPVVGPDIISAALAILNDKKDLTEWNSTLITLIPKVKDPLSLKDFRPISLCNTCYKIVSRAISNCFRPALDNIVDQYQSAFTPGRLIIDNVIVGFESMHWIRNNKKSKSGYAALKLDMSKAYDRVEWNFLEAFMLKLGFAESWVGLIMRCVRSMSYSFRINHNIFGTLKPQRGLR